MGLGTKAIANATTKILDRNTARSLLVICNVSDVQGGEDVFLGFDQDAVLNSGIALSDGDRIVISAESPLSSLLSCEVNGICAGGAQTVSYEAR